MREPLVCQLIRHVVHHLEFGDVRAIADIDDTTRSWQTCPVEPNAAEPIDLTGLLVAFAVIVCDRYRRTGKSADLDAAVVVLEQCTKELPDDHPHLGTLSQALADLAQARYDNSADVVDLDSSIWARQRALAVTPDTDPRRSCELSNLGVALLTRYLCTEDPNDLEKSVHAARAAVSCTPSDHPHRDGHLRRLAHAMHARFMRTMDASDISEALTILSVLADHPDWHADDLFSLAILSWARYGTTDSLPDLDGAITAWERWLVVASEEDPHRTEVLIMLCEARQSRYENTGNTAHLDAFIESGHVAVAAMAADHPKRKDVLSELVDAHQERFRRLTDRSDLNGAVDVARFAVEMTPRTDLHWPCQLTRLGRALLDRHDEVGSARDLDEAITTLVASIKAAATDHPERPLMWLALARAVKSRYHYYGDVKDLDSAVRAAEEAVRACPTDDTNHVAMLSYLSDTLWTRHEHRGDPADLNAAIEIVGLVVKNLTDERNRAEARSELCLMLRSRYRLSGDVADLDAALAIGVQAEHGLPAGDSSRGQFMIGLGAVRRDKYERTRQETDFAAAVMALRTTAESRAAGARDRERAARECGDLLAEHGNWRDASTVYSTAVATLPLLAWRGLDRESQERQLIRRSRSARDATACAVAAGQPARAVEALEYGRSVLWSQSLDTRTDLTALAAVHPGLARHLAEIRRALDGTQFGHGDDAIGRAFP